MEPDKTDRLILDLLEADARTPVATLARELGLSRTTIKDRMARLEAAGVISGYTIRLNDATARRRIASHVLIDVDPKYAKAAAQDLAEFKEVKSLYAVSGVHDLIAIVRVDTTEELDALIDKIGAIEGIERTTTSIILSTKIDR